MNGNHPISLYFHIPFCTKKCHYCHFYVIPDREEYKNKWMEGIALEYRLWQEELRSKKIETIYFGGGTPALIGPERLATILSWIPNRSPDAEITLEVNPENITHAQMQAYREAGVNRVSIGVQTLNNPLLHTLGRTHNANRAIDSIYNTLEAGISNISIDLMYDLPSQTVPIWQETLKNIQNLPITHLSLYNLTIEPHTVFFKNQKSLAQLLPDEDSSLQMYEGAIEAFESFGLIQYEISAFAKAGKISHHNIGYWTGRPFLGLGPSAFSYWNHERFRNVANLNRYRDSLGKGCSPVDFREKLESQAHLRELFVIALRVKKGIDLEQFQKENGILPQDFCTTLIRLVDNHFIKRDRNTICLTRLGMLWYDSIASELI